MKRLILLSLVMSSSVFADANFGNELLKAHKGKIITKGGSDTLLVAYCTEGLAYLRVQNVPNQAPIKVGGQIQCHKAFWRLEKVRREPENKAQKPNKVLRTFEAFTLDGGARALANVFNAPMDLGNHTDKDNTKGVLTGGDKPYGVEQYFETTTPFNNESVRVKRGEFNDMVRGLE